MPVDWKKCRHLIKIDPDKPLNSRLVEGVLTSGTDGILIGGTQGITRTKVEAAWDALRDFAGPVAVEISSEECLIDPFIPYWVPMVLNSPSSRWLVGAHQEAFARFGGLVDGVSLYPVGYIVMNPRAAVARKVGIGKTPTVEEAEAWMKVGRRLLGLPALYIEYSGVLGPEAMVRSMAQAAPGPHRIYGGGIGSGEDAKTMAKWVDTVVVGNLIYEPFGVEKVRETVEFIKNLDNKS